MTIFYLWMIWLIWYLKTNFKSFDSCHLQISWMKFESKTLTTTNLSAFLCRSFYPLICSKNRDTWLSLTAGLLKNVRPCDTFSCNLNCFASLKNTKSRTNHNKFMSIMTCGNLLDIDYTWEIKWTKIALARACMNIKSYPISVPIL